MTYFASSTEEILFHVSTRMPSTSGTDFDHKVREREREERERRERGRERLLNERRQTIKGVRPSLADKERKRVSVCILTRLH